MPRSARRHQEYSRSGLRNVTSEFEILNPGSIVPGRHLRRQRPNVTRRVNLSTRRDVDQVVMRP
jgi:hypothetical protein